MKPIEYREIDNPASLLKKLNEMIDEVTYINNTLRGKIQAHFDLISRLTTRVGILEAREHAVLVAMTSTLPSEPITSETDRAQAPAKDDTNINTK